MLPLKINPTRSTPSVHFDKELGIFEIKGNSYPQDTIEFYMPVEYAFQEYCDDPNPHTNLVFQLDYFHSTSIKSFYKLIAMLNKLFESGREVSITWRHKKDDEDLIKVGKELAELLAFPFHFEII